MLAVLIFRVSSRRNYKIKKRYGLSDKTEGLQTLAGQV